MPSLHRSKRSRYWVAHFKVFDRDRCRWVRVARSTRCEDKAAAVDVLAGYVAAARTAAGLPKGSSLSAAHVEGVVVTVLGTAGVQVEAAPQLPGLRRYVARYMASKAARTKPGTLKTYQTARRRFERWLPKGEVPLDWLTAARVQDYYTWLLQEMAPKSANDRLRWLSGVMNRAVVEGYLPKNPCASIDLAEIRGGVIARQPFTLQEALQIVTYLSTRTAREQEWAKAALISLQTGARLVDCITMERSALRHEGATLLCYYVAAKTGKANTCPLVLTDWQGFLLGGSGRQLCPLLHSDYTRSGNAHLSHEFTGLVGAAGVEQLYAQTKTGRTVARKTFHSLRHTLRTAIVLSGGSDAQADLVLGHSAGQGKRYTHAELQNTAQVLRQALGQQPPPTA